MAPVNINDVLRLVASLGDAFPPLVPAKDVLTFIGDTIQQIDDNKSQYAYLFKRCTDVCLHVKRLAHDFHGDAGRRYAEALAELNT